MKFFDLLATASANMLRNKTRSLLTIIAIFVGAFTITLTSGIGAGVKSYLDKQIGDLGANNVLTIQKQDATNPADPSAPKKYNPDQKVIAGLRGEGSQLALGQKDIDAIKTEPHVVSVRAVQPIAADYITAGHDKFQVSITEAFGSAKLDLTSGRIVDDSSSKAEITIPVSYVQPLGFARDQDAAGKTVTIGISTARGEQHEVTATIVGVQQKTLIGSTTAYVNTTLAEALQAIGAQGLPAATQNQSAFLIATLESSVTDAQVTSLKNDLKNKNYVAQTTQDKVNMIFTIINAITIVLDAFGVIALLAASFGIVNTLLMSVQERTREIGLMKALGMSPRKIFILFSFEAVLIGFWGSVLGVGAADLIGHVVDSIASRGFLKDFAGLQLLAFPFRSVALIILGIMLLALLAGTLPAARASRKDPIEALRYE